MKTPSLSGSKLPINWNNKSLLAVSICAALTSTNTLANGNVAAEDYEKIIVTGQKISRTLQESPASIAVYSDTRMKQQNISEISEVLFETANVHSSGTGSFNIRGIDAFNVSGAGSSGLASIYVDGAPLPRRLIQNGFSTWDAKQIEVLRGPQSTLQGRNSLAGAIVMTTHEATHEFKGKYRLQVGENGEREAAVALGGSLIENELAFRFSGEKEELDGFNYNPVRKENSDFREDDLYRLKLLYTPQSLPEFSAQLSFMQASTEKGSISVDVPDSGSQFNHRLVHNNDPQTQTFDTDMINLVLSYTISDEWTFESYSTQTKVKSGWEDFDNDNGPEPGATRFFREDTETLTQEFRFIYTGDRTTALFGAYYYDQDIPNEFGGITSISLASVGVNSAFLQAGFGLDAGTADFVVAQYADFDPVLLDQLSTVQQNIKTTALFADVTYELSEQWDIFAGLRWDREEQENADTQSFTLANIDMMPNANNYSAPLNQLITGINNQLLANVEDANQAIDLADASFTQFLPKIGLSYRWTDDITASLSIQQGYRSGGVGVNSAKASSYQFDPELTTNYELAMRSFWLDGDLMLNANVFYIDWKDQQVDVQLSENTFDSETRNAGKSTVQGFELELNYQITPELEFYASIGQADTEFKDFIVVVPTQGEERIFDLTSRSFPDAPEWTANTGFTFESDNGIFANVSINYADSSPVQANPYERGLSNGDSDFDPQNDSRTIVNMQFGYQWDTFGVYLIGKNVFDEEYIARASIDGTRRDARHTLGKPRQLSIALKGSF